MMAVAEALGSLWLASMVLEEKLLQVLLCCLLLSFLILAIGLKCFKRYISGKEDLPRDQITVMSLTFLNGTTTMAADALLLGFINKSYLSLIAIIVFGFILVIDFFYQELQFKENHETPSPDEREPMLTNSIKFANIATTVDFLVQVTEITAGYITNPKFPKDRTLYNNLTAAFINTILDAYATDITSCPLAFRSESLNCFLKLFPPIMTISLKLLVALLSAEFLDYVVLLALIIPPFVEYMARRWLNNCNSQAIRDTSASTGSIKVDPMCVTIVRVVYTIHPSLCSVASGSEGHVRYKYTVLLLHFAHNMIAPLDKHALTSLYVPHIFGEPELIVIKINATPRAA